MRNLLIGICVLGIAGYFGSKFYLHDKVSRNLDLVLSAARPIIDVRYEGIGSTLTGELSVDGITARFAGYRDAVQIGSVSIVTPGYFDLLNLASIGNGATGDFEFPEEFGIAFRGVNVAVDADYMDAVTQARRAQLGLQEVSTPAADCVSAYGFSSDLLKRLGYRELLVDAAVGYRQDNQNLVFDLSTRIADMYDMTFELTFDGVPSPQSIAMRTYHPRLVGGRLEYVDRSLEERVMKLCTESEKLPVETVIAARVDAF
ncbi:MAG: hypothetical protein ACREQ8_05335, partial [Woeseiaceae bacterium]